MERALYGFRDPGRAFVDPEDLLAAWFDLARFWGDVEHVMQLTIPEMRLYLRQAVRIAKAERAGAG